MNLVLIGLRGTGKSTVGQALSARLNREFYDTDSLVQERAGMSVRELFEQHGEARFREIESQLVQECATAKNAVIATGGGAVLAPENVSALKKDGFIVHLTANPAELWHRISRDQLTHQTRPKLVQGAVSGVDELTKLLLARAAIYACARDVEVSVEGRTPDEVVEAIVILMRAHGVR